MAEEISKAKGSQSRHERIAKQKEEVIEALNNTSGIIASACKRAGISRSTFYEWCKTDAEFNEKIDEVIELQKDFAEALILKKMKEGDTSMIIFYAKTKMKDRGYTERQEITGRDGEDLIKHNEVDLSRLTAAQREALLSIGLDILDKKE